MEQSESNVMGVVASGKLTASDYEWLVPQIRETVDLFGSVSLLVDMEDFHGWEFKAAWEDMKLYSFDYNKKIDKIAMVGDQKWEEWMTKLSKPFLYAKMDYFDQAHLEDAWKWVKAEQ